MNSPVLTLQEAAERLHVALYTVRKWAKKGTMPGAFRIGSDYRINGDILEQWIREQEASYKAEHT